jgi:hypothetical protein
MDPSMCPINSFIDAAEIQYVILAPKVVGQLRIPTTLIRNKPWIA